MRSGIHYVSGRWYGPAVGGFAPNITVDVDTIHLVPIYVHSTRAFDAIGVSVGATVAADCVMGIYALHPNSYNAYLLPGSVSDPSPMNLGNRILAISQVLIEGWYYLAFSPELSVDLFAHYTVVGSGEIGHTGPVLTAQATYRLLDRTYDGALPSIFETLGAPELGTIGAAQTRATMAIRAA